MDKLTFGEIHYILSFHRNAVLIPYIFCVKQYRYIKTDIDPWDYKETVHQLFIHFNKTYDSVRKEVLYNILIQFGAPLKLDRLIKMCLNETYSKVRIGKYLSDKCPIENGLKIRRCFMATAFKLHFRICHYECPGKTSGTEIKWETSVAGLC
jgi:hypothetical protein